jgi:molybdopterin-guanine dinucleotide biosynthesis protein A
MGQDKAFLEIGGQRIIDRTVNTLRGIFSSVLIITNNPAPYVYLGVRTAVDLIPNGGALGGLYTALFMTQSPNAFVVGCDMPFLNPDVIRYMLSRASSWDVVVPRVNGYFEPLHAVYARRCLAPIRRLMQRNGRKISDFYPQVRVLYVEADEIRDLDPKRLTFRNINSPDDLLAIETLQNDLSAPREPV